MQAPSLSFDDDAIRPEDMKDQEEDVFTGS
jgi:hypothetical protein